MDSATSKSGDAHVLVVEDHEPTARIIATVVEDAAHSITTHVVGDGKAALDVMRGDTEVPRPDLVLLDLDLPILDGFSVLEIREEDPVLSGIPTVVLSGWDHRETIDECYERGANAFIAKPNDLDGYSTIAERVIEFWVARDDQAGN